MTQKKRETKRRTSGKQKRHPTVIEIAKALDALPLPARAIVSKRIDDIDRFRRQYPDLYDLMFKEVDSKDCRRVERQIERVQQQKRSSS